MKDETQFRWPDDGNAINVTRDVLASVPVPEIVDYVLPELSGKSVLACWMLASGAEPTHVRTALNITETELRGMCGAILEATQQHTGDTFIMPIGGKP